MKLYVGGLPFATTDDELKELFAAHGTVTSANVITDKFSGRSRGFGFVEMASNAEGQAAVQALNGTQFGGRTVTVSEARPMREKSDFGGGGGDRGGRGFGGGGGRGQGGPRRGGFGSRDDSRY